MSSGGANPNHAPIGVAPQRWLRLGQRGRDEQPPDQVRHPHFPIAERCSARSRRLRRRRRSVVVTRLPGALGARLDPLEAAQLEGHALAPDGLSVSTCIANEWRRLRAARQRDDVIGHPTRPPAPSIRPPEGVSTALDVWTDDHDTAAASRRSRPAAGNEPMPPVIGPRHPATRKSNDRQRSVTDHRAVPRPLGCRCPLEASRAVRPEAVQGFLPPAARR
jgi:hypothetical protein